MTKNDETYRLLFIEDVMKALGQSRSSIERAMRSGAPLPYVKLGTSVRFRPEDVDAYIESRIVSAGPRRVPASAPRRKRESPMRVGAALKRYQAPPGMSLRDRLT